MCIRDSYYRISKVHAIAIKSVIGLIIEIPLQSARSQVELFVVKPLPYYDKTLAQFVTVHSDSVYLAVSKSRLNYVMLSYEQVFQCIRSPSRNLSPQRITCTSIREQ